MNDLCWNKEFAMGQVDNDEELLQELIAIFQDSLGIGYGYSDSGGGERGSG